MTPKEALAKLENMVNIGFYLPPKEVELIRQACDYASEPAKVAKNPEKVTPAKTPKKAASKTTKPAE